MEVKQKTKVEIWLDEHDVTDMIHQFLSRKSSTVQNKPTAATLRCAADAEDLEIRAVKGTSVIQPENIRIRFVPEGGK